MAYTRTGSTLQVLEGKDLEKAVLKSSGTTWDDFEAGNRTVADLDREALSAFRRKSVANKRLTTDQAAVSDETLIENLNLMTDDGRLTRAAAMLFSDPEKIAVKTLIPANMDPILKIPILPKVSIWPVISKHGDPDLRRSERPVSSMTPLFRKSLSQKVPSLSL